MTRASRFLVFAALSLSFSACGSADGGGSPESNDASDDTGTLGNDVSTDTPAGDTHVNVDSGKDAITPPTDGTATDAPDDATTGPFDPRTWTPKGKGLWIWYFS